MIDVGHGRPVSHSEGDPVVREDRDFIDAVLGMGNRIRVPYAEALKTLGLTLAATRSAKEGREITLKDELAYV
jgi:predicted dehydrogenase